MLELNKTLYKKIYLLRRAEEGIRAHYHENDMKTPMHMSLGEEAVAVGVCHAIGDEGQAFSSYRSHAIFLAKTSDTDAFFAELYARETSALKGRCGSMHLSSPKHGFLGASAIVASQIPVAVGVAFANKIQKNGKIVATFFGDGAVEEGVFWESLNAACLKKLPVIFVYEDNEFAIYMRRHDRHGFDSILKTASTFNCHVLESESTDVEEIFKTVSEGVRRMREDSKPMFVSLKYYRYLEHLGINYDFNLGYRGQEEYEKWLAKDPVTTQRAKLARLGATEAEITAMENEIDGKIGESIARAKQAPPSDVRHAATDVFK